MRYLSIVSVRTTTTRPRFAFRDAYACARPVCCRVLTALLICCPCRWEHLECSMQPLPPGRFTKKLGWARGAGPGGVLPRPVSARRDRHTSVNGAAMRLASSALLATQRGGNWSRRNSSMARVDKLAVIARYREDISWLSNAPIPHVVVDKSWIANVGGDATSYLAFILLNYHSLPRWCLFMHAHEYHWHHAQYSELRSMRIDVDATGSGFLSVSHATNGAMVWFSKDLLAEISDDEHMSLRRDLLGLRTPYRGRVQHTPCGMFWVRRDRILARPLAFYQRLYRAMTNASHPLLSRYAVGEGYPARMLHVFFIEGYWHYIFGEDEDYRPPYTVYDKMPLAPLSAHSPMTTERESSTLEQRQSAELSFPPLNLTYRGLLLHVHKQQRHRLANSTRHESRSKGSSGDASSTRPVRTSHGKEDSAVDLSFASDDRSPRQLLARVAHGCSCSATTKWRVQPKETCIRAADSAIRLLLRLGEQQQLANWSSFCGALAQSNLMSTLSPSARQRIHSLQSQCFGGVGGSRDYALSALTDCINKDEQERNNRMRRHAGVSRF